LTGIENYISSGGVISIDNTFISQIDLSQTQLFNCTVTISNNQYLESVYLPENGFVQRIVIFNNNNSVFDGLHIQENLFFNQLSILNENSLCNIEIDGYVTEYLQFNSMTTNPPDPIIEVIQYTENGFSLDLSELKTIPFGYEVNLSNCHQLNIANEESIYNWDINTEYNFTGCIQLSSQSDIDFCQNNNSWSQGALYSLDCFNNEYVCNGTYINDFDENSNHTKRTVVKLIDALGREVNHTTNQILFHIYDDGSVEKKFIVE
tara:strand:+ start:393 stop:1181 length:789 start_codon:yes stop_codon:yes gene_type:complete